MGKKSFTNQEIAKLLKQMAAVFEVKNNNFFRARAYTNASIAIANLTTSVQILWQEGKLNEIPGVGKNLSQHLNELFSTGKVKHFNREFKKVPQGMFSLLKIRGIGPKTAYKLSVKFKLNDSATAIKKLKKLIKEKKLKGIKGFGEKLPEKIKSSLNLQAVSSKRMLISTALSIADDFLSYLNSQKSILKAEPLGSLRRHSSTIGDIDIAIRTKNPKEAMNKALKYEEIGKVISSGESVARVKFKTGHEVYFKLSSPQEWGSLLQHYTGSKQHNILLRTLAQSKGMSLSEHGIKNKRGKSKKFKNEKSFYAYLGLSFIPPELREGEDEIKSAQKNKIPKLVKLEEIKGDLHLHSDFKFPSSHDLGASSLFEIFNKARELNYEYLGFADHNPKQAGLTYKGRESILKRRRKYLVTQYQEYEKRVKTRVPELLIGLEIDIRPNGDLALEDKLINALDYAIVSIHSSFNQDRNKTTKRILSALKHPKAVILGHPTGRMINKRSSIQANWGEIFTFCAKNNKIIEVNADPSRLDLPSDLIKQAIKSNAKFIINSDGHHSSQMKNIKFGVWTAKKGWSKSKDILNTQSLAELINVLNSKAVN